MEREKIFLEKYYLDRKIKCDFYLEEKYRYSNIYKKTKSEIDFSEETKNEILFLEELDSKGRAVNLIAGFEIKNFVF